MNRHTWRIREFWQAVSWNEEIVKGFMKEEERTINTKTNMLALTHLRGCDTWVCLRDKERPKPLPTHKHYKLHLCRGGKLNEGLATLSEEVSSCHPCSGQTHVVFGDKAVNLYILFHILWDCLRLQSHSQEFAIHSLDAHTLPPWIIVTQCRLAIIKLGNTTGLLTQCIILLRSDFLYVQITKMFHHQTAIVNSVRPRSDSHAQKKMHITHCTVCLQK